MTTNSIEMLIRRAGAATAATAAPALAAQPQLRVTIVTCMDCRIDPAALLGLEPGEAHVLRNAGGSVTDDVIRSLAISQRKLGTTEVMLIHHTRCGMLTLTDDEFRRELLKDTGTSPPFAIEAFADPDEDVRQSIRRVRNSPYLLHRDNVRGFVLDIETLQLREVPADG